MNPLPRRDRIQEELMFLGGFELFLSVNFKTDGLISLFIAKSAILKIEITKIFF